MGMGVGGWGQGPAKRRVGPSGCGPFPVSFLGVLLNVGLELSPDDARIPPPAEWRENPLCHRDDYL